MVSLLISLLTAAVLVPLVMAVILSLIYLLGELFHLLSQIGRTEIGRTDKKNA